MQITLVATTFWALTVVAPFTRFGWWVALGGTGNISLGQTGKDGMGWTMLGVAVPLGLALLVPYSLTMRSAYSGPVPRGGPLVAESGRRSTLD
ncbi:hypothetical protein P9209_17040 [Prescottella defluvii]|nr:hypothetical protein P9209_17040 [Prescottella defluvii]